MNWYDWWTPRQFGDEIKFERKKNAGLAATIVRLDRIIENHKKNIDELIQERNSAETNVRNQKRIIENQNSTIIEKDKQIRELGENYKSLLLTGTIGVASHE